MTMKRRMFCSLILSLVMVMQSEITLAQTPNINTTVYADKTRFESQEENAEFRVEVFNASGQKMFDSGFVAGQTLDWNMLDQQGEPVADGVYDYVVTIKNGKKSKIQSSQISVFRDGQDLEKAPTLMQPAAAGGGSGGGSGNLTGSGTAGQITKWTGGTSLGDSALTESGGKVGIGTTNPVSVFHIIGSHPVTSTLAGTNATEGLRITGGKGGDTSGSGQIGGNGSNIVLQAGDGGDALAGTSGRGGSVTIQPGAAGVGSINGAFGQVTLAPGGGNVGIGVTNAGSKLTVAGMIETTLGGLKFPDGTTQNTAATSGLASVFHDTTLIGNGTSGTPLGVANSGIGNTQLADNAVTAPKIATGQVVKSLNGLVDGVSLLAGSNVTITPSTNSLTIAASGGLSSTTTDNTLTGNGTGGLPLGVRIPLRLIGSSLPSSLEALTVTNLGEGGFGMSVTGGDGDTVLGGYALTATAGNSNTSRGGVGVTAIGGDSNSHDAGDGINATGGDSGSRSGGLAIRAEGGAGNGVNEHGGYGIYAIRGIGTNGAMDGFAGFFVGDVHIIGDLSVGGTKNFKIDHPLDTANKYLIHAAIESSEVLNVYSGNVTTDASGNASVTLPDWFEALNKDFRYQLTAIGTFAQAIVGEKVKNNRFVIKTNAPNVEVSWQVTGVRSDAAMLKHPFEVEQVKPERERGHYLSPEAFDQPEEKGIEWARNPELMKQMKERREQMKQRRAQQ